MEEDVNPAMIDVKPEDRYSDRDPRVEELARMMLRLRESHIDPDSRITYQSAPMALSHGARRVDLDGWGEPAWTLYRHEAQIALLWIDKQIDAAKQAPADAAADGRDWMLRGMPVGTVRSFTPGIPVNPVNSIELYSDGTNDDPWPQP